MSPGKKERAKIISVYQKTTQRVGIRINRENRKHSKWEQFQWNSQKSHTACGSLTVYSIQSIKSRSENIKYESNQILVPVYWFIYCFCFGDISIAFFVYCVSLLCVFLASWLRFNFHCFVSNACTSANISISVYTA